MLLQLDKNNSQVLTLIGTLKGQQGLYDEALEHLSRSLKLNPRQAFALNSQGNVLRLLNLPAKALSCYDKAIALQPGFCEAYGNRGIALEDLGRFQEAIANYDRAIALKPDNAEAYCRRGHALEELQRPLEALDSYCKAIAVRPDFSDAYQYRLILLRNLDRHDEALQDYERLMRFDPGRPYLPGEYLAQKMDLCLWDGFHRDCERLRNMVETGAKAATPFSFLKIPGSPAAQLRCARTYAVHKYPPAEKPLWRGERYRHDRIRVGYFSSDFCDHATAYLMAELFERHDRSQFEVFGFSFGRPAEDEMRARLSQSFEHFLDIYRLSDPSAAQRAKDLEIDIAIDLKGFTRDARPRLFALRPAPIQVNYLGFPATMGAPYIDYIVADHTLIPPHQTGAYAEKIVFLPHTYQPNDTRRRIAEAPLSRRDAGLPENGFVFCCFNNSFKITPDLFDIWMGLLRQIEGSVLWLLATHPSACRNLRREAQARGVSSDRLIFAPKLALADHLARCRLADLSLDTFHCNAHTTASDALWAGVPVLTCPGQTFASRVAASLVKAVGLPELIAGSPEDYESVALRLARNGEALRALRERLARNRLTHPLFDIALFTRHLEAAYLAMSERHKRGEAPDHIDVASLV